MQPSDLYGPGGARGLAPTMALPLDANQRNAVRQPPKWKKLMPVAFMLTLIFYLFSVYLFLHIMPLLQYHETDISKVNLADRGTGEIELGIFVPVTFMLLFCYYKAVNTPPGGIPSTREWIVSESNKGDGIAALMMEKKKNNELRQCKWCQKFKPDRCHHCRVSGTCVLKMDHHCPWIWNTVGFHNHKYFYLLLFYSVVDLGLIACTLWETVGKQNEVDTHFAFMFLALYAETLAVISGLIITTFFIFHTWLLLRNMTTIEFCEKNGDKDIWSPSRYSMGVYANICSALGSNPLFWLLPFTKAEGDGLSFVGKDTTLTVDMDIGTVGRKGPKPAPVRKEEATVAVEQETPFTALLGEDAGKAGEVGNYTDESARQVGDTEVVSNFQVRDEEKPLSDANTAPLKEGQHQKMFEDDDVALAVTESLEDTGGTGQL